MNETGAILLEAIARLDYQTRSRCTGSDNYHRVQIFRDGDHAMCINCEQPIKLIQYGTFVGWIEQVYIIIEWP